MFQPNFWLWLPLSTTRALLLLARWSSIITTTITTTTTPRVDKDRCGFQDITERIHSNTRNMLNIAHTTPLWITIAVHHKSDYQQLVMLLATGYAAIWNHALSEVGTKKLVFAAEHLNHRSLCCYCEATKLYSRAHWCIAHKCTLLCCIVELKTMPSTSSQ